ncbi:MAG: NTP transferase domain-containing protein [Clostridia bacterium]|nr:NTP transferase domain-containing protein [Clostridia bacterium]
MNIQEFDVLNVLAHSDYVNQRKLAEQSGHSIGKINSSIKELTAEGLLDPQMVLTKKAQKLYAQHKTKNAVILAAGFGMRIVPINTQTPKGLIEIHGEPLIERLIKQLREVGVENIYIVVGFLKESYEYLIDKYGVKLIVNVQYAQKNNLHSLNLARKFLDDCYIVPCDIWCRDNPFKEAEFYSWYMVNDQKDPSSLARVNKKKELVFDAVGGKGNTMVGIAYFTAKDAKLLRETVARLTKNPTFDHEFWEAALYNNPKLTVAARLCDAESTVDINTYEQLRDFDITSNQLKTDAISIVCDALNVKAQDITDISVSKAGMTNRSFLFNCKGQKYIMRIPGEGTDQLINRTEEAEVYTVIRQENICDRILYINPENGYKITEYLNNARTCNTDSIEDLTKCMKVLREFHEKGLTVKHCFDIFEKIDFYESLWNGEESVFKDYRQTKANVLSLKEYVDTHKLPYVLTHIDANEDNFLFAKDKNGKEKVYLIDWEYAAMQDPHVDIAMFCIYSMYERDKVEELIDIYFEGNCDRETRIKIYCYIAMCGLLWSNWCEYKRQLGVEFGEYSLAQYRFAKDYYKLVVQELEQAGGAL